MAELPKRKPNQGGSPVSWKMLAAVVTVGGGAAAYINIEKEKQAQDAEKRKSKAVGKPDIGGPIELVGLDGKIVHSDQLKGKWTLLYFGFTFCPDICPEELDKMAEALDICDTTDGMAEVQPVFVTIDPDRDTPEKLKSYLKEFHPRLVGLTGTNEQVKKAAKTFRVYYSKPIEDDSDDYLVDHTIIMYLMDPEWNFTQYYGQFMTAQEMADGMVKEVAQYNSDK